ncbi:DUF4846 domain-containing protein [Bradymonas sediminis]|uniref:Uncharacterized protein n=1 Tax=Bradymonas sediminis TaxID=1548548 RepID=A0A2Z4FMD1_9DELT|nr:DUF4846 domain-containing protein [Bradymonas sediminis]AWV89975.1 hypothetical protein DN745_11760 [Bradymonas sediminis]TDP76071.1 uncharacterized protein DUF4846 [Bradymonas sediminis]
MSFRPAYLIAPLALVALTSAAFACFAQETVVETTEHHHIVAPETVTIGTQAQAVEPARRPEKEVVAPVTVHTAALTDTYAWLAGEEFAGQEFTPMDARFAPPEGYTRVEVAEGTFAAFLRGLPLLTDRRTVHSYSGERLRSPSAAIVAMDVGARNLQQCADTAIRLHAEYLWSSDQRDQLAYHFTSGDETRWGDWKNGERFRIAGSKVKRVRSAKPNGSRAEFRRWLDTVFMYAGTRSLRLDSKSVQPRAIEAGDFFVAPGSPGHAVIVLDVAENAQGQRIGLVGQGFMPAQELHVIRSRGPQVIDQVWFVLPDEGQQIDTPSWDAFSSDQLRRFTTDAPK